jgi:uncharacterized protein YndB with AHSA1/START domain
MIDEPMIAAPAEMIDPRGEPYSDIQTGDRSMSDTAESVRVTHDFEAEAQAVFDAWLDEDLVGQWMFGPEVRDEEIISLETKPWVGGTFGFVVRRDGQRVAHRGEYLELETSEPYRLLFTWIVNGEGEEGRVAVDVTATEYGSNLELTHELPTEWEDYAEQTRQAWAHMFECLESVV